MTLPQTNALSGTCYGNKPKVLMFIQIKALHLSTCSLIDQSIFELYDLQTRTINIMLACMITEVKQQLLVCFILAF